MIDIIEFTEKYNMLPAGSKVLCAVSGGADSVCMLHVLYSLAPKKGFSLEAAHFNHMLRGDESDRDELFTVNLCQKLGVLCHTGRENVAEYAQLNKTGIEDAARKLRYKFLSETAEAISADRIATAHTADDNAETVIMHLVRGTGLNGLCGIPPVRGNIIRPLLNVTRHEIEDYNSFFDLPHVEDSTNALDDYMRNRIRHSIMPELRKMNPDFAGAVTSMTALVSEDNFCLNESADQFIQQHKRDEILISDLSELPPSVLRRVIIRLCGNNLNKVHVDSVISLIASKNPSAKVHLPGITVRREYNKVIFGDEPSISGFTPVELSPGKEVMLPGSNFIVECSEHNNFIMKNEKIFKSLNTFFFNYDIIYDKIVVRSRKSGDTIKLPGGTRSLKKLFIDRKIPVGKRQSVPVVSSGDTVIAVYGIGINTDYIPRDNCRVLKISIREQNAND